MKIYSNLVLLIMATFICKLNAENICVWKPEAGLLTVGELNHTCKANSENEFLDFNELTRIGDTPESGYLAGIYKDKYENIWFIKESLVFREYVGSHILRLFLGDHRIAEVKMMKGYPSFIASKKLENFQSIETLSSETSIKGIEVYSFLENYEELVAGMNYVGLSDRNAGNQGCIKKDKILEAARVDYDWSFKDKDFDNWAWFDSDLNKRIDYGKLERAIVNLLNLPDDQIYQALETGAYLDFSKEESEWTYVEKLVIEDSYDLLVNYNQLASYLEERKRNFRQLLPLITCLKKVLNEGDINYLSKNKNLLITFQNVVEPDSQLSYLNVLVNQMVQRGCLEALKKLKELGFYE